MAKLFFGAETGGADHRSRRAARRRDHGQSQSGRGGPHRPVRSEVRATAASAAGNDPTDPEFRLLPDFGAATPRQTKPRRAGARWRERRGRGLFFWGNRSTDGCGVIINNLG